MNREEKRNRTRARILVAASAEFAEHGYETASLNTISQAGGISKGIIYHYFDSKDALYITCLERCFRDLTDYITEHLPPEEDSGNLLSGYFDIRMEYFRGHRENAQLFCGAVLLPPARLKKEIAGARASFDRLNDALLRKIIEGGGIRADLSETELLRAIRSLQDYVNAGWQAPAEGLPDIDRHERDCRNILSILMYGILSRE